MKEVCNKCLAVCREHVLPATKILLCALEVTNKEWSEKYELITAERQHELITA